jgi:GxxExxY protein
MELIHKETTDIILASFYNVYNTRGYGFLEKVYENALFIELTEAGLICEKQKAIEVFYKEMKVGSYFADIIVNNEVIIELKAAEGIVEEHEYQLLNYLRSTEIEVGLLLNFGKKTQFKRKIYRNKSVLNQ